MEVGRRRSPVQAPPAGDAGEPRLLERLRAQIERDGPLTFARFMELALYDPDFGYYASSTQRPTRAGDFLTAPELHPIFGLSLARQLDEMWRRLGRPASFTLREYGPGGGALVVALARGLAEMGSPLAERLAYQPRDLPAQRAELAEGLAAGGLARLLERAGSGGPITGCVLANEFVDALPVHRLVVEQGRLRELYVGWDGGPVEISGEPSRRELAEWFDEAGVRLAEGQRAEVNLAMLDWLAEVAAELERGYVLVIDYGAEPAELYGQRRRGGTLRAFRGQHVSGDVLRGVGHQDLTAHVDLGALARGARAAGLDVLGSTTLAHFLMGCDLEQVLAGERERANDDWSASLLLRSAVGRLLDPRALGGYAVVVLGREVAAEPPLRGLGYRLPGRT